MTKLVITAVLFSRSPKVRRHNLSSGMPQTQREESRLTLLPLVPGEGLPCSPCVSPADTPPMFLANGSTASVGGFPTQKSSPASPLLGSSPNSSAWLLHPTASHAFPAWAGFQCSDPSVCLCPLSWRCSRKGLLSHSDLRRCTRSRSLCLLPCSCWQGPAASPSHSILSVPKAVQRLQVDLGLPGPARLTRSDIPYLDGRPPLLLPDPSISLPPCPVHLELLLPRGLCTSYPATLFSYIP